MTRALAFLLLAQLLIVAFSCVWDIMHKRRTGSYTSWARSLAFPLLNGMWVVVAALFISLTWDLLK